MFKAERAGVVYFQFDGLAGFPELDHRVLSRKGGVSQAPFNELNVAYSVGDRPEDVHLVEKNILEAKL